MPATFDNLTEAQRHTAKTLPVAGELLAVMLSDLITRAISDLPAALIEFGNQDTYDYIAELTDGEFINETVDAHLPGLDDAGRSSARSLGRTVLHTLLSMTWPGDKMEPVLAARDAAAQNQARIDAVSAENRAAAAASDGAGFGRIVDGIISRNLSDV